MIDFTRCRIVPYQHQRVGIEALISHPYFFLADEMGAGKTKQVIDAAQYLYTLGRVRRVLVISPAAVRGVWFDQELGELAKHLWLDCSNLVMEYHSNIRAWVHAPQASTPDSRLEWYITNYDYIRSRVQYNKRSKKVVLDPLLDKICQPDTLLVLDESSAVKNHKAKQSKACLWIRNRCGRVWLLNGTPIANNPLDMYAQGRIMHLNVTGHKSYYTFKAKYAITIMTDAGFPKIVGWQNLEDLQRRFAPYILRRLKEDCLDLPKKLPSVPLTATLSPATWKRYTTMRDELCVWLNEHDVSTAPQAGVKVMRLAQIVSGFLGGVEPSLLDDPDDTTIVHEGPIQHFSHEKLDTFMQWLDQQLENDPKFKVVVWARFRAELTMLMERLVMRKLHTGSIHGNQSRQAREDAIRLLDPRTTPDGPVVVGGIPEAGGMGLTLTAAHVVVYLSNGFSLKTRLQSEDRVHRPGQTRAVSYFDFIAQGPQGQKTIDHLIQQVLRNKLDVATWTSSAWVSALRAT
jgi:SWI/SNF-related matrix-associated actin-dependent regulator of chromatin subfamily A-like protein 1